MRILFIISFFAQICNLCAQKRTTGYFGIKKIKQGRDYSFPVFSSKRDSTVSNKINSFLQIIELECLKRNDEKSIFDNVGYDPETIYGGKVEIKYALKQNGRKVLSVMFKEESCGATCRSTINYYNFNSQNGELIRLKDLFTESGYKAFYKKLQATRVHKIKKEMGKLDSTMISVFKRLPENVKDDSELEQFYIKDSLIYVDSENCLSKHEKFCGLNTIAGIRLSVFSEYLNEYGKCLFDSLCSDVSTYHSLSFPQLYSGTIAKRDALVVINFYDKEVRAEYIYKEAGSGKYIEGGLKTNRMTLVETNKQGEAIRKFNLTFLGDSIKGSIKELKTNKRHEVKLGK